MNTITWLHISDLHFREKASYDENIVLRALLRDVVERIARDGLQPDLILVSGDVAYAGKPAEYDLARRFFDDLLGTTDLGKDRLFLVPGNHDVDRDQVTQGARAIADSLDARDKVNGILAEPDSRRLLMARFAGYAAFLNDYLGEHLSFDDERYFYVRELELAGLRLALLGLNSAWASASGEDEAKGLLVGEPQVRAALDQAGGADLKIALLHHPFELLRAFDRRDVEPLLCDNCDLVLHGHMHQTGFLQARSPDGEATFVAAGACYETRRFPNSHNYVRLDPAAGTGVVHLRRYSDQRGGFWASDTLTYRNVPDGTFTFPLPAATAELVSSESDMEGQTESRPVAGAIHIDTGGGTVVFGDVGVEDGDFVGRDRYLHNLQADDLQPLGEYNVAAIRSLLRDAFTDTELRRFCQDRPLFRPVLRRVGSSSGLEDLIDELITYCEKQLLYSELLSEVQNYNPRQYARYSAHLGGNG